MFSPLTERRPQRGWGPKLLGIALAASAIELTGANALAASVSLKSTCAPADRPARAVSSAIPDYPGIPELQGLEGASLVLIHLSADGNVESASIAQSAGHPAFDREALRTVRNSRFAAETVHCQAVEGEYLYRVVFTKAGTRE